ncbi:pro-corazonin-like isoform X1 [Wyeomyia smithii]|uniref:pro-corazonin-like isoform X1 n=1 Tax=Wyeomyia smithii TaxID=174621 RepID=UPI002467B8BF|nr:pro-corazonin-like isoform X1 [Wyeomyia smithii]
MKHACMASLIVSLLVIFTDAQTFQYSRGWTNGKRSSGEPSATNHVLVPHFNAALEKPNDNRLLIQRMLKSPCDVRIANAMANRNKDLRQQLADESDTMTILYDPSGLDNDSSEDLRLKRDIRRTISHSPGKGF